MSAELTRVNLGRGSCDLGYLWGGARHVLDGEPTQHDLDAAPTECESLRRRVLRLLKAARALLGSAAPRERGTLCSSG